MLVVMDMDANTHSKYDDYLKALVDISKAITSDLYIRESVESGRIVDKILMGCNLLT